MYHKKHKYDLIILFSVFILGISLFLAISESRGITVPCGITGGCEQVLTSKYSHPLGLPLPLLGIAYTSLIIVLGLLANHYPLFRRLLTWLLGMGAVFSLIFLSIQFLVLKAICQYCLTVDVIVILMFLWDLHIEFRREFA